MRLVKQRAENRFVVRRVNADTIREATGFEEDDARTVVRNPAPTLPPGDSLKFEAPKLGNGSFIAAPGGVIAGKYELREKVAQGTFGVVFTAKDLHLDRDVAIKLLNPAHIANKDIVQRFLLEARAAARIAHPGIVTMFDCGAIEGQL